MGASEPWSASRVPPLREEWLRASGDVHAAPRPRRPETELEQVSDLVGTVYDAALDPSLWPKALEQACHLLDCFQGAIGVVDLLQRSGSLMIPWGYEPERWQEYVERYYPESPLARHMLRTRTGDVYSVARWEGEADFDAVIASPIFQEWILPQGQIDAIQATLEKTGSGMALLGCVRHKSRGYAGEDEFRLMRLIAPHFRRALLIGKAIDLHKIEAAAFTETIDGLAAGVFLVNALGELIHANVSGERMLAAEDPVKLVGGVIAASGGAHGEAFARAVSAARDGDVANAAAGTALPLRGQRGDAYTAHVLPLTGGARREAGASRSAVAALFVRKASVDLAAAIAAAAQLYGFTPAEVRVLGALIECGNAAAVAAMLQVSRRTVQTHLSHLFAKTGTRRQAELVRLVAGFDSPARLRQQG